MMTAQSLQSQVQVMLVSLTGLDESIFDTFEFRVGVTPMTHIYFPFLTVLVYCIGIPTLQHFMRGREAPPLKYILLVHNIFLSVGSFLLLAFLIVTIASIKSQLGYNLYPEIFCGIGHNNQRGTLQFIYYVNYLFKYYELLDTIFLALKHKPIGFLHAYHHPATLVLAWAQLLDSTGVQWVVIVLNLFVHTIMYFYYAMAALKIKMPWKRIVTITQIVQFILDLAACYIAWGLHSFWGRCFGTNRAGVVGVFVLTSYLYLFVDFYQTAYHSKKVHPSPSGRIEKNKKE
mmetsp:Transcript_10511/g.15790  ORF Transcript_10511/g.15790 Transcript_10511/m.15790 type:complete len:288 (+) Transcript_10511:39-902(+)